VRRAALALASALTGLGLGLGLAAGTAVALPDWPSTAITSSYGSGAFGRWETDAFGLPSYRYAIDEERNPIAHQSELAGSTDGSSQIGNDHVVADAFNHGYVQLWSQDRRYQWTNRYDGPAAHFAGGYGYLRAGGRITSTLYDDRPAASRSDRIFGAGYFRRDTTSAGLAVREYVYAPFGDDPVLLHDVTIRNDTPRRQQATWFEYWDVNPFDQATKAQIATGPVRWLPSRGTLASAQRPTRLDRHPLTIFSAALQGPVAGHVGDTRAFFGRGSRARPAAVAAGSLNGKLARAVGTGKVGRAMFGFSAPVVLGPHASVTLRYAYGAAHATEVPALVRKYRRARSALRTSEARWRAWLPQIVFGGGRAWLSRELQWDAYMLRSGASYEDCRGRHIISQGGYYQYALGFQGAFRDPLEHSLPMIYADPSLARDVLLYSAQEQPRRGGQIPYAMSELCRRLKFGNSDDLDVWLLLSASEYGLATRDLHLFDLELPYSGGGRGTLWEHLKLAFHHQESLLGPHGGYIPLDVGDWSDLSTTFLQMTESMLVPAQAAFIYQRLAALAVARGDRAFAAELRRAATRDLRTTRGQWTSRGWYARGYAGTLRIGTGAIFGEPQPWAILDGAPDPAQARRLVANIRRFLLGMQAPERIHGPTKIGAAQSPAAADPAIRERSHPATGNIGAGAAVFPGGSWYAVNGWLTWALGTLGGVVPHARDYAFSELLRNTLAAHAAAYPGHWDGITSVDDVCYAFYSPTPAKCGAGLTSAYAGQIMHQPAWSLFDAIRLAGVTPTASGYEIRPELPMRSFSLALPYVGVAYDRAGAHGYIKLATTQTLTMEVKPSRSGRWWVVFGSGDRVRPTLRAGMLRFKLHAVAGRPSSWAITSRLG
jgi:hypothetical protein